jgi:hypothetical protein
MKMLLGLMFIGALVTGCATLKNTGASAKAGAPASSVATNAPASGQKLIITPGNMLVGKVVSVNENARFAVLNFPVGLMAANGQQLYAYRRGLKVAEVKVTGPQQDDNTVADVVNGEVQVGDEIRPN